MVLKPGEDPDGGSPAGSEPELKRASGGITSMLQSSWRVLPSALLQIRTGGAGVAALHLTATFTV